MNAAVLGQDGSEHEDSVLAGKAMAEVRIKRALDTK